MAAAPAGTVTLLFTDIEGSTRLLERTGKAYPALLAERRRLIRAALERHDGQNRLVRNRPRPVAWRTSSCASSRYRSGESR